MYQLIFSVYRAGVECVSCFILSSAFFFLVVDEHKLLEGNFAVSGLILLLKSKKLIVVTKACGSFKGIRKN